MSSKHLRNARSLFARKFNNQVLDYSIRVTLFGAQPASYGLAWWTVVPEPASLVLIAMATLLLLVNRAPRFGAADWSQLRFSRDL